VLFNSFEFIFLFLPVVFCVYFLLNHLRVTLLARWWLVGASLFFYGWWNVWYLPLIIGSVVVNFLISRVMGRCKQGDVGLVTRGRLLFVGLAINVGLLAWFKYLDFFVENVNAGLGTEFSLLHLALPLAISFYTLQQIAFLVDTYEGLAEEKRFRDYALFVTFFPQLIAGPIVHHSEVMPQFARRRNLLVHLPHINMALFIFAIGLFKKVVIADTFATWATPGFDHAESLNLLEAWVTSLSYTFQIYFDFSGYTDMAIGAALLFNVRLPQNFNSPYLATSIVDFWQRWHMTLTAFITTYVYTPILRMSARVTFARMMTATLLAFLISGLWHGAAWTFVVWGMLHGAGIVTFHCWRRYVKVRLPRVLAWIITFNFINVTFVVFRATEISDVFKVLRGMMGLEGLALPLRLANHLAALSQFGITFEAGYLEETTASSMAVIWLAAALAVCLLARNSGTRIASFTPNLWYGVVTVVTMSLGVLSLNRVSEFLYFNF
jgi:alginate O-acetyltransferase complex protein AlgI